MKLYDNDQFQKVVANIVMRFFIAVFVILLLFIMALPVILAVCIGWSWLLLYFAYSAAFAILLIASANRRGGGK